MRYAMVECDGCGKNLFTENYYHEFGMSFNTYVKDPNTNQSELNSSMSRKSNSTYCDNCFDRLVKYIKNFADESKEIKVCGAYDKRENVEKQGSE